jgi:hypothetical protein
MSLAGRLYKLQQLDLELQKKQQELSEVENQLSDNKALVVAESRLASQKEQLEDARKKQKSSEWELEDLHYLNVLPRHLSGSLSRVLILSGSYCRSSLVSSLRSTTFVWNNALNLQA